MNTADTSITSGSIIYSLQQVGTTIGNYPIFKFPGINIPTIEDLSGKMTGKEEAEEMIIYEGANVFELEKKYFEENKGTLLEKYIGKYIAIINKRVVDSDKDFSKLAQRVYEKFGYRDIYMPLVDIKEQVVRVPSPKIRISND